MYLSVLANKVYNPSHETVALSKQPRSPTNASSSQTIQSSITINDIYVLYCTSWCSKCAGKLKFFVHILCLELHQIDFLGLKLSKNPSVRSR